MKFLLLFKYLFFVFPYFVLGQVNPFSTEIKSNLVKAGSNKVELEKAINYFIKKGDPLQLQAIYFLIGNADIHHSFDYYWKDSNGKRVYFNELDYNDFATSLVSFEKIKKAHTGMITQTIVYSDITQLKSEMLISDIELAFKVWQKPWNHSISFQNFCEYILPYKSTIEPIQNWRPEFVRKFHWLSDSAESKPLSTVLRCFVNDYHTWFTNTYKIEENNEPLPRLGGLQLLFRKKGACGDIADLSVFALRSQGIASTIDEVPFWATSSGRHYLNVCFTPQMQPLSFDVSTQTVLGEKLNREPAKVIRITYSKQKNTLASLISSSKIPAGFMQLTNYLDVTNEYWKIRDVSCQLFPKPDEKIAYSCVFNFMDWRPSWWGKVIGNQVIFKSMCQGAVFLPMYYINSKLQPAGYPVVSDYNKTFALKPDLKNCFLVRIYEQAGYLAFRQGKKYTLYYWNNTWKTIGTKVPTATTKYLEFEKVPKNALYLLVPEYSQHKERPFIVSDDNVRQWF